MADFAAHIRMLPRDDGRKRLAFGPTWICRLRFDQEDFYASLNSREGYLVPDRSGLVYATLLDISGRRSFEPGDVFDIIDDEHVATGVVEPPNRLPHPIDNTLTILQTWVRRRPERFVRARLELTEDSAGWTDLIEEAFSTIDEVVPDWPTDLRVAQVKQKLGGLVIYVQHQLAGGPSAIIKDKLNELHRRSLTTCELCGNAGSRGSQAGYICVRCCDCAPDGWPLNKP